MKQKDFYYSTLYIYDKVLADTLAEDLQKRRAEQIKVSCRPDCGGTCCKPENVPYFCRNREEVLERLSALERQISALQSFVAINQA